MYFQILFLCNHKSVIYFFVKNLIGMLIKLYPKYNNINEIPNSLIQSGIKVIDKHIITSPKPIVSTEMINNNHIKINFNILFIYNYLCSTEWHISIFISDAKIMLFFHIKKKVLKNFLIFNTFYKLILRNNIPNITALMKFRTV